MNDFMVAGNGYGEPWGGKEAQTKSTEEKLRYPSFWIVP